MGERGRVTALWVAIAGNLGSLAYFKYSQLLVNTARSLLAHLPLLSPIFQDPITLGIILPLGISFFTFEFIHYAVEVYKGREPIKSPVDFALFAAFFPTQIAGPIKRFPDFMKQIAHPMPLRAVQIDAAVWLILRGLLKKILLADSLAPFVATAFAHPGQLGPLSAWAAVLAFAAQIYGDFSGYTDIGRGSARLLGYSVPENFTSPYQSANPAEFWHRWHMSLSTWLRDYLYIPLGGSRVAPARIYLNLMLTMALGGLWHGAQWHFMVWGVYQGVLLCGHRLWQRTAGRTALYRRAIAHPLLAFATRPLTLALVCAGWVFFRADTLPGAFAMLGSMLAFGRAPQAGLPLDFSSTPLLLLALAGAVVVAGWIWAVAQPSVKAWASPVRPDNVGEAMGRERVSAGRPYGVGIAARHLSGNGQATGVPARVGRPSMAWMAGVRERLDAAWLRGAYVFGLRPALFLGAILLLLIWPPHAVQRFIYFQF
jgi:D-alanyl-lipoteichoic acid acyltransferase DltB (MBOAT superfamily)